MPAMTTAPQQGFPGTNPATMNSMENAHQKGLIAVAKAQERAKERAVGRLKEQQWRQKTQMLEKEYKPRARDQAKAEEDRIKGLPESTSRAWPIGMKKHIIAVATAAANVGSNDKVPQSTPTDFSSRFNNANDALTNMATEQGAVNAEIAQSELGHVTTGVQQFRDLQNKLEGIQSV